MKISVITPYYKGLKTISKTINSVLEAKKIVEELELDYIVMIDSMEDKEIAKKSLKKEFGNKIRVIENEKNLGVAETRNRALKLTEFDYALFLDQDDIIDSEYFKFMKEGMEKKADIIISNAYVVNTKNNKKVEMYRFVPKFELNDFLRGNKILSPGQVLFSKKVKEVEKLYIGCSEEYKGADDWAAYLNIFTSCKNLNIFYVKKPIFYYMLHETNYSKNWKEMNLSAIETARYFLGKVDKEQKNILTSQIDIFAFENKFKDEGYKITYKDLKKIYLYYSTKFKDINKIIHYINKKIISFD
ncbi:MAG: glycosyltransferase family 2 protein [Sarcina sp.]